MQGGGGRVNGRQSGAGRKEVTDEPLNFSFIIYSNPLSDRRRWYVSTDVFKFGRPGDKFFSELGSNTAEPVCMLKSCWRGRPPGVRIVLSRYSGLSSSSSSGIFV